MLWLWLGRDFLIVKVEGVTDEVVCVAVRNRVPRPGVCVQEGGMQMRSGRMWFEYKRGSVRGTGVLEREVGEERWKDAVGRERVMEVENRLEGVRPLR